MGSLQAESANFGMAPKFLGWAEVVISRCLLGSACHGAGRPDDVFCVFLLEYGEGSRHCVVLGDPETESALKLCPGGDVPLIQPSLTSPHAGDSAEACMLVSFSGHDPPIQATTPIQAQSPILGIPVWVWLAALARSMALSTVSIRGLF